MSAPLGCGLWFGFTRSPLGNVSALRRAAATGELVEAASELDEAKFEAAITCLLCGAETAIGAHVREAVAHGLSFAAGQAWVAALE